MRVHACLRAAGVLLGGALALAGCGAKSSTTTTTVTLNPKTVSVRMVAGHLYDPRELTVNPGDTVVWSNADTMTHTVIADETNAATGGPNSDAGQPNGVAPGKTYSFTVPAASSSGTTWYYHCRLHGSAGDGSSLGAGMAGSLSVR